MWKGSCKASYQTDSGKESVNRDVEALLKQQDIELLKSPAYTPQFNQLIELHTKENRETMLVLLAAIFTCLFGATEMRLFSVM